MNNIYKNNLVRPFEFHVDEKIINQIKQRVKDYPWHEMPSDGGWDYGANLDYMKELCAYWVEEFDWQKQEELINSFSHFKTNVTTKHGTIDTHFIYEKGSGDNPTPLLLCHGWPVSVAEFFEAIDPLAHPEKYGGNVEDAFDVIAPSLPGFGFSAAPDRPMGPRGMADVFSQLMCENLGYENYIAQGGDWGGAICSWLGYEHAPNCSAIHINILTMRHKDGPQTEEEIKWAEQFERDQIMQNGYRTQQATRPQTLSYGMMDSPVGIAAWLIEKFHDWSDLKDNDIKKTYSMDELLTNIMIYITTKTFNTSTWIYYGRREEGGRILSPEGKWVEVPTGCAVFPEEMLAWPPRTYVDRIYNVQHWTEMPRGGHFGILEEPELMVADIRKFARSLQK